MSEAILILNFIAFSNCKEFSFDEIIINDEHVSTKEGNKELKIPFNKYELDLGRKVCRYMLVRKECENKENEIYEENKGNERNEKNEEKEKKDNNKENKESE
jgi:hypothetical protein